MGAPAVATAADVGHRVERIVVPGVAAGEQRQVDVYLGYPAVAAGEPKTVYTSALLPNGWEPLSWTIDAELARGGRRVRPSGGPYTPIVFSHGANNDPFDYARTLEAIAAAACPGIDPDCAKASVPNSVSDRVRDVSAVLDELPAWFGATVDAGHAGVMGHSRGTVTALAAAGGSIAAGTAGANWTPAPTDGLWWTGVEPDPRVKAIMDRRAPDHQRRRPAGRRRRPRRRRPLDAWSVPPIAASFPGYISGKAVHYCSAEKDGRTRPPCTGLDTDAVQADVTRRTVAFRLDVAPPGLTVPANLTVDATSPAGATVTATVAGELHRHGARRGRTAREPDRRRAQREPAVVNARRVMQAAAR